VAQGCDWPHPRPIGSGSWAGVVAGERWWRSSGGAAAGARAPARMVAGLNNVWHGYLPCDLVEVLEGFVDSEFKRGVGLSSGCLAAAMGACAPARRRLGQGNLCARRL
jgi:hypothetical protein